MNERIEQDFIEARNDAENAAFLLGGIQDAESPDLDRTALIHARMYLQAAIVWLKEARLSR